MKLLVITREWVDGSVGKAVAIQGCGRELWSPALK